MHGRTLDSSTAILRHNEWKKWCCFFLASTAMNCASVCRSVAVSFSFNNMEFHREILRTGLLGFWIFRVLNSTRTERCRERGNPLEKGWTWSYLIFLSRITHGRTLDSSMAIWGTMTERTAFFLIYSYGLHFCVWKKGHELQFQRYGISQRNSAYRSVRVLESLGFQAVQNHKYRKREREGPFENGRMWSYS